MKGFTILRADNFAFDMLPLHHPIMDTPRADGVKPMNHFVAMLTNGLGACQLVHGRIHVANAKISNKGNAMRSVLFSNGESGNNWSAV